MTKKDSPEPSSRPSMPPPGEVAPTARRIMRLADKISLATIDGDGGGPFLSLTGVATLMNVTPILLMSDISRHTKNLDLDPRASLLFDGTGDHANPLTEDRVSVIGRIVKSSTNEAEQRFMARHPKAFYAQFADFSFYEMHVEEAHFVGGFGTALSVPPDVLCLEQRGLKDLLSDEQSILKHMNEQHTDAVRNMAVNLLQGTDGPWQLTGIDPEGCDFMMRKERCRLDFSSFVKNSDEARQILVSLAKKARA